MSQRTSQQTLAFSLALCLFLVSSLLTATAAKHAIHSSHDHATHQQTWCGWMCAAGQAVHTPSLDPAKTFALIAKIESFRPHTHSFLSAISSQSRAPPISFT